MSSKIELRQVGRSQLYQILQDDKVLDTAEGTTNAQIKLGRHRARIAHEDLIKERDKLQAQLDLANEAIEGYHHRIGEIDTDLLEASP